MSKIMGIDHGSKRIGIAISDSSASIAFGREVIFNDKKTISVLKKLIKEEEVTEIVIGYPLNLKGEKTAQTLEVEKFEEELIKQLAQAELSEVKISRWDERFTSKMAADSLFESGMKKKKRQDKSNLDIISAALMLQSYLDQTKNKL
jgi:putative holliday junction resolvase